MARLAAAALLPLAVLLIGISCADKPNTEAFQGLTPPVSERRDLLQPPPKKLEVGDDCGAFGAPACRSGICFETAPKKFHCSRACRQDSDCEAKGFECAQVPAPHQRERLDRSNVNTGIASS